MAVKRVLYIFTCVYGGLASTRVGAVRQRVSYSLVTLCATEWLQNQHRRSGGEDLELTIALCTRWTVDN